jgi:hypothetical protein
MASSELEAGLLPDSGGGSGGGLGWGQEWACPLTVREETLPEDAKLEGSVLDMCMGASPCMYACKRGRAYMRSRGDGGKVGRSCDEAAVSAAVSGGDEKAGQMKCDDKGAASGGVER